MIKMAVEVGGTFTDLIWIEGGEVRSQKVPSTPEDASEGVISGLQVALGEDLSKMSELCHGSTVATNAIIERRGCRAALVTTAWLQGRSGTAASASRRRLCDRLGQARAAGSPARSIEAPERLDARRCGHRAAGRSGPDRRGRRPHRARGARGRRQSACSIPISIRSTNSGSVPFWPSATRTCRSSCRRMCCRPSGNMSARPRPRWPPIWHRWWAGTSAVSSAISQTTPRRAISSSCSPLAACCREEAPSTAVSICSTPVPRRASSVPSGWRQSSAMPTSSRSISAERVPTSR